MGKENYILLSLVGIGILLVGVIFSNFMSDYIAVPCALVGIVIVVLSFVFAKFSNNNQQK